MKRTALFLTLSLTAGWVTYSAPVRLELPTETATLKKAPGMELAAAQCLTCHSAEYIGTQPKLARAAWKASVDKMRGKFGAPIPEDQIEKLADYLAAAYGKPDPAPK